MRVIIAGAGEVGTHLAKLLSRENIDISLMDDRADRIEGLDADYDMLTMVGVPTSKRLAYATSICLWLLRLRSQRT